jgi:hypothetical protein
MNKPIDIYTTVRAHGLSFRTYSLFLYVPRLARGIQVKCRPMDRLDAADKPRHVAEESEVTHVPREP